MVGLAETYRLTTNNIPCLGMPLFGLTASIGSADDDDKSLLSLAGEALSPPDALRLPVRMRHTKERRSTVVYDLDLFNIKLTFDPRA